MKLSIIVPVYNVELYLRRCVDSILSQTFTDYELILVDDGSPDNCGKICDEYAQKDARITVIHKANGGLSDARNAGLRIATGEFVGFVDSDDEITPDMYSRLMDLAQKHEAQIVGCGTKQLNQEGVVLGLWPKLTEVKIYHYEDFILDYLPFKRIEIQPSVTNKILRRELFEACPFPKGKYYEDDFILLELLRQCKTIVIDPAYCYHYYICREGSITNLSYNPKRFALTELGLTHYEFFCKYGEKKQQEYALSNYTSRYMVNFFAVHIVHKNLKPQYVPYQRQFRSYFGKILHNPEICKVKKLTILLMYVNKHLAYRLCKKYFPECLPEFLRAKEDLNP